MKKLMLISALPLLLLAACRNDVPKVDDPHKIVVDGSPISQKDFMNRYCTGKTNNQTCYAVSKALLQDATKGKLPSGW